MSAGDEPQPSPRYDLTAMKLRICDIFGVRPEDVDGLYDESLFTDPIVLLGGDQIEGRVNWVQFKPSTIDQQFLQLRLIQEAWIKNWASLYDGHRPPPYAPEAREVHGDRLRPKPRVAHYT